MADYCASKFAAYGYNEALRREMKSLNKRIVFTTICTGAVNTGMYNGYQPNFFNPMLNMIPVTDRIEQAILQNEGDVFMPWFAGVYIPFVKALFPTGFQDFIFKLLNGNSTMKKFKGRTGASAPMAKTSEIANRGYKSEAQRTEVQNSFKE